MMLPEASAVLARALDDGTCPAAVGGGAGAGPAGARQRRRPRAGHRRCPAAPCGTTSSTSPPSPSRYLAERLAARLVERGAAGAGRSRPRSWLPALGRGREGAPSRSATSSPTRAGSPPGGPGTSGGEPIRSARRPSCRPGRGHPPPPSGAPSARACALRGRPGGRAAGGAARRRAPATATSASSRSASPWSAPPVRRSTRSWRARCWRRSGSPAPPSSVPAAPPPALTRASSWTPPAPPARPGATADPRAPGIAATRRSAARGARCCAAR